MDVRSTDNRRVPDNEKKSWQVSQIWDMYHEVIRLLTLGMDNQFIARTLKITPQQVSNIRNSKVIKERLAIMHAARDADTIDIAQDIMDIAPDSVKLLKEIIRGEGENTGEKASVALRAKTAESNLDRSGFVAPKRFQTESIVAHYTGEEIENIKKRARRQRDLIPVFEAEVE